MARESPVCHAASTDDGGPRDRFRPADCQTTRLALLAADLVFWLH
jgi:hypothetical protein